VIDIAIVGCGRIVEEAHVPALRALADRVRVRAIADPSPARRAAVGDALGVAPEARHGDCRELLDRHAAEIEVVDLALPHALHRGALLEVAGAGLGILTEKPLTVDLDQAREVTAAIAAAGVPFGIIHNYHYAARAQAMVEAVAAGRLGRVFLHRTEGLSGGYWPGTAAYHSAWRAEADRGGRGCLLDNGYHQIYLAELLVGSPIFEVYARIGRYNRDYSVEDTALALLTHANGAVTSLQVGWSVAAGGAWVSEVHGTRGSLSLTKPEVGSVAFFDNGAGQWTPLAVPSLPGTEFGRLFERFFAAVAAGGRYPDGLAAAWKVMAVLEAAYRSAETGRAEPVEPPPPAG